MKISSVLAALAASSLCVLTGTFAMSNAAPPRMLETPEYSEDMPWIWLAEQPFKLVSVYKDGCLDDGGGLTAGATTFRLAPCGVHPANQAFVFDPATSQVRSVAKPSLCLNDGNATSPKSAFFQLRACAAGNANQTFVFDNYGGHLTNPSKPLLCMDDGETGVTNTTTAVTLNTCSSESTSQFFIVVPTEDILSGHGP